MDDSGVSSEGDAHLKQAIACATNSGVAQIEELAKSGFIWLDLRDPAAADLQKVGEQLQLHPLTIEDLQEFGQRTKVEEYPDYVYLVTYGAAPKGDEDRLAEIHLIYGRNYLLTVSRDQSEELEHLHQQIDGREMSRQDLLHSVLDELVDSYAPVLDDLDARINGIEDQILAHDLKGRDRDIHLVRREVGAVDRIIHRQNETYASLHEVIRRMPGHSPTNAPYFRDVQDHLIRVTQSADALRERTSGLFEIYMAALDNRQNIIMKQFTVIAGIFLPLSVLTGFFGMNFGWLVRNIDHSWAFFAFGVGLPILIASLILWLVWRRGLLSE
jgi:magnesium transporter